MAAAQTLWDIGSGTQKRLTVSEWLLLMVQMRYYLVKSRFRWTKQFCCQSEKIKGIRERRTSL